MTAGRLFLLPSGDEITRRRSRVPKGRIVEAWPDLSGAGFWVGEHGKALLDAVAEPPLGATLWLPVPSIPIYYGPHLCDIDSLPAEESLLARVLSTHGIAVAWATVDRFGQRNTYEPQSPADPTFHLRRPGGGVGHLWRLFQTKQEAIVYMSERYGKQSEGAEWARALAIEDFDALLEREARS